MAIRVIDYIEELQVARELCTSLSVILNTGDLRSNFHDSSE